MPLSLPITAQIRKQAMLRCGAITRHAKRVGDLPTWRENATLNALAEL